MELPEKSIHDEFSKLAEKIALEHNLRIENIYFEWYNVIGIEPKVFKTSIKTEKWN